MMTLEAYIDSGVEFLREFRVTDEQLEASKVRDRLATGFVKGRDWTEVMLTLMREFNIIAPPDR